MSSPESPHVEFTPRPPSRIQSPQNFFAGLALLALALFAFWALRSLSQGTLGSMGPAMLPRILAGGVGACGLALMVSGLRKPGPALQQWSIRAPFFVLLGVAAFAVSIRTVGLAVAGPLAMVISGFASPETRLKEILIFAVIMTAFCAGLFKYALNLPIPILRIGPIQL